LFLLPRYQREAARLLEATERDEMERHIANDPERHPLISGGSGMRKARWARPARGKSGGRVIYYFAAPERSVLHCGICQERKGEYQ